MAKPAKAVIASETPPPDTDAYDDMYGSAWLSADDIKKPFRSVIEGWERSTFKQDGKNKDKAVLKLKGVKKSCVLNKTNVANLALQYGKDFSRWVGKPVLVKTEMTQYGGKSMPGLRLYPVDPNDMNDDIPY
jgi:hypothetical protein